MTDTADIVETLKARGFLPADATPELVRQLVDAARPMSPAASEPVSSNLADTLDELGCNWEATPPWQAYLRHDQFSEWARHAKRRLG